jgi:ribosomal protein L13E
MNLFRHAFDYYGSLSSQQLLVSAAVLAVTLVLCFVALELLRRAWGYPVNLDAGPKLAPQANVGREVAYVSGYSLLELERAGITAEQAIEAGLSIDRIRNSALGSNVIQVEKLRRARGWKRTED